MINTLVFVSLFCIVAVLVYMARYSGRIRVSHSRLIDAPIDAVFAQVSDLGRWRAWNSWLTAGADTVCQVHGAAASPGSQCSWSSRKDGAGTLTLSRCAAPRSLRHKLRIDQPFQVRGRCDWTFVERAGQTEVSWQIKARSAFTMRAFAATVKAALALDCQYALDQLAGLLEPPEAPRYTLSVLGARDVDACRCVIQTYQGPIKDLPEAVQRHSSALREALAALGISAVGDTRVYYLKTNIKLRTTVCQIALPVGAADVGTLEVREMPAQRCYGVRLSGSSTALEIAWYRAMQRLNAEQYKPDQRLPPFEHHLGAGEIEVNLPLLNR